VVENGVEHSHDARLVGDLVEVVEHQDMLGPAQRPQLVREHAAQDLGGAVAGTHVLQRPLEIATEARALAAERLDQMPDEHHRVGIGAHERVPDHRAAQRAQRLGEQRGLAVAGVGDDRDERPVEMIDQRVNEPRAGEQARGQVGRGQLRPDDGRSGPIGHFATGAAASA